MNMAPLLLTALLSLAAQPAHPKKTVLITDAEGVAGVCRQEQVEPSNRELQKLLTGEVNAAVRGFLSAGADEVIVWDGHDGSRTLSVATLYYSCLSLTAERAQELIERKAALAFAKAGQVRPYRLEGPVSIEVEHTTRSTPFPQEPLPAGVERIGPRTLRFSGRDFLTAWTLWSMP